MTKKSIATIALVVVIGVGTIGISSAFAQDTTNSNPMDSLVQKIAAKFNVKQSDVQAVFDEERTERQAAMQKTHAERLSQLVKEGKITESQKQLIVQKEKEMQTERDKNRESLKNLTHDERRTQMETKRSELEKWAKQNNIDMQYILPQNGREKGVGYRGMNGVNPNSTTTKTPTQTVK